MKQYSPPAAVVAGDPSAGGGRCVDSTATGRRLFVCRGNSMSPVLRDGDVVEIAESGARLPRRGDIVVAIPPDSDETVIHRVVRIEGGRVRTMGDNGRYPDPWALPADRIRGTAIAVWRGKRRLAVLSGRAGAAAAFVVRAFRAARRPVSSVFRPVLRPLVRAGVLRRIVPARFRPNLLEFRSRGLTRRRLVSGGRAVGWQDPDNGRWHYIFPYGLLADPSAVQAAEEAWQAEALSRPAGAGAPAGPLPLHFGDSGVALLAAACGACLNPALAGPLRGLIAGAEWEVVFRLAGAHCAWGLLFRGLREHAWDLVPAEAALRLRTEDLRARARNLQLAGETAAVCGLMAAAGIRHASVKGPALGVQAYGDAGLRISWDIDVLIHPGDSLAAVAALENNGHDVKLDLPRAFHGAQLREKRELMFGPGKGGFGVELLLDVVPAYSPSMLDHRRLWSRIRYVRLAGEEVPSVSREDHFLLCCAHGAKHEWERLLWIMDVAGLAASKDGLDWAYIRDASARSGGMRRVLTALALARAVTGLPVPGLLPPDAAALALADECIRKLAGRDVGGAGIRGQLAGLERIRDKARYVCGLALRPSYSDWKRPRLPPPLHFLYRLIRPARLLLSRLWRLSPASPVRSATNREGCSVQQR